MTGVHTTHRLQHADGQGVSLVPDVGFAEGETVTVSADIPIHGAANGTYEFGVARKSGLPPTDTDVLAAPGVGSAPAERAATLAAASALPAYRSRPDLHPPRVDILSAQPGRDRGLLLASPLTTSNGTQLGPIIYDDAGQTIWFRPSQQPSTGDLQRISWFGTDALAWFEGSSNAQGEYIVVDSTYREVGRIRAGNGYKADIHDVIVTPWGTAYVIIYAPVIQDLTPYGGRADATVEDGVIQEVDLRTGAVLFEWHSLTADHFPITDSQVDITGPVVDYIHLNSFGLDDDGNLLVTGRNVSAAFKVNRATGDVMWRLGGRRSSFTFAGGDRGPLFPHDVRRRSDGAVSVFDNGFGAAAPQYSRGVAWTLDETTFTATRELELRHQPDLFTPIVGNTQELPRGGSMVSFGTTGTATEFDASGTPVFESDFDDPAVFTYRTYRQQWHGRPAEPPALSVDRPDGTHVTASVSWNGATEVARWQLLAGPSGGQLRVVGDVPRSGFETTIAAGITPQDTAFVARAVGPTGSVLGSSATVQALLFEPLGGRVTARPASTSWSTGRIDVAVRGGDTGVWHNWAVGVPAGAASATWNAWESLGGATTAGPAITAWAPGRLDVFVAGTDGQLWHKFYAAGWSGWEPLGGVLGAGPAVASWASGRLDVFVRGTDGQLWHKWYDRGWSGWESLGGQLAEAPSVASWGPGRLDVTVPGVDRQTWHRSFDRTGWSNWESLGGATTQGPATVAPAVGQLRVLVTGTDGQLWQKRWTGSWSNWTALGSVTASGPGASVRDGATDVFVRALDERLWRGVLP